MRPRRSTSTYVGGRGLAALLLFPAAVVLAARAMSLEAGPLAVAVTFTPYLLLASLGGLAAAAVARSRGWAVVGVVVTLAVLATQAPLFCRNPAPVPGDDAARGPDLRVATVNLRFGRADPGHLVRFVRDERVDVLSLQELTGEAVEALAAAGLDAALPHRVLETGPGFPGTGLWSRLPLRDARRLPGFVSPALVAVVDASTAVTVAAVHPAQLRVWTNRRWADEHDLLHSELTALPGTVIVAGDLNATPDHAALRRLSGAGFVDAADQAGAGLTRTWPVRGQVPGPLFALDHVLVRGPLTASAVTVHPVPGSDHAALLAVLTPPAPGGQGGHSHPRGVVAAG